MTIRFAQHGEVRIAYETVGEPVGEPLLLIMGLQGQMIGWPDGFCTALHRRGFHVVRFDNRDVGESTHLPPPPDPRPSFLRMARPRTAYTLEHMAGDAVAVLDDLGWRSAHLVGISVGAAMAQILAARQPDRVRTLTSIMSTPSPRIGRIRTRTLLRMTRAARRLGKPTDPETVADFMVGMSRITGSPGYPPDDDAMREMVRRSMARDPSFLTAGRAQTAAFRASGDRRAELAAVRAPTLVVHGDADVMVGIEGGRATVAAIPGARLVVYPGLGHGLPRGLWEPLADEIAAHADMALRGTTSRADPPQR